MKPNTYYTKIDGILRTVTCFTKDMALSYFLTYCAALTIKDVRTVKPKDPVYTGFQDGEQAAAEQQQAENWEHNQ